MRHNSISSLFVIAGTMTAVHYNAVALMVIASGPPETGKSTAIKVALSLTGQITSIPVINAHMQTFSSNTQYFDMEKLKSAV